MINRNCTELEIGVLSIRSLLNLREFGIRKTIKKAQVVWIVFLIPNSRNSERKLVFICVCG